VIRSELESYSHFAADHDDPYGSCYLPDFAGRTGGPSLLSSYKRSAVPIRGAFAQKTLAAD
jgi:hypothetical protein